jgi:hypothetical protein
VKLNFWSGPALARLKYECERGTVSVSRFVQLLECAYGSPRADEKHLIPRGGLIFLKNGRPWRDQQPSASVKVPRTPRTIAQSLTLGNGIVRRRLEREEKKGILPLAIARWLMAHAMKETPSQPKRMYYSQLNGQLPWEHDPMAEQEREAIAAQKARNEAEELARASKAKPAQGPADEAHEAEDPNVPELVREEDFPR